MSLRICHINKPINKQKHPVCKLLSPLVDENLILLILLLLEAYQRQQRSLYKIYALLDFAKRKNNVAYLELYI